MRTSKQNFIIDTIAFVCFVFLASTGAIMHYILPPGSGHQNTIWQMDRHEWGNIHFWFAIMFLGTLVLHLFLHWTWIVNWVKGKRRKGSKYRIGLGLVGLIFLLAIALAPILSPVEHSSDDPTEELDHPRKKHKGQKTEEMKHLDSTPSKSNR